MKIPNYYHEELAGFNSFERSASQQTEKGVVSVQASQRLDVNPSRDWKVNINTGGGLRV